MRFVVPIIKVLSTSESPIMDGHLIFNHDGYTQNFKCPSTMTPSKVGKTINLIFYSLTESIVLISYQNIIIRTRMMMIICMLLGDRHTSSSGG